jgi:SAM-dependent methyltransferase
MAYVHGYSERETQRLYEQAVILEEILHTGTAYPAGAQVLEAGCGVGAQTRLLLKHSPQASFTCLDISEKSLTVARQLKEEAGFEKVTFQQANIHAPDFTDETFDHIFICFVLEHLDDPVAALTGLKRVLKSGGTITCIEGDHGSCFWYPETPESIDAWNGLITAQRAQGHHPNIGRRLTPLLEEAGFDVQSCEPAWLYADRLSSDLRDGMVNHIIVPMVQSAQKQILEENIVPEDVYAKGIADLSRVDQIDEGTFFYTWFKAAAAKQ